MKLNIALSTFSAIIIASCSNNAPKLASNNNPPAPQLPSQTPPTPKIPKKVRTNALIINNLSGNFGETFLNNKLKRVYTLENDYSSDVVITSAAIDNHTFSFHNKGFPGILSASTKVTDIPPCDINKVLKENEKCLFAVTFQPISEKEEAGTLKIKYTIDKKDSEFKYALTGKGKEESEAHKKLALLKDNFIKMDLIPKKDLPVKPAKINFKNYPDLKKNLIKSVLEDGHSKNFNYQDYFSDKNKSGFEVWQKQFQLERVIGYTFRGDSRGPEMYFNLCDKQWREGFTLKNPLGKEVKFPPQIDEYGNGRSCGVKDVGGFWPTFTRPYDMLKMNNALTAFKDKNKVDFDPKIHTSKDLHPNYAPSPNEYIDYLNWYLQNVLNVSAHVHGSYDFKGFISTAITPYFPFQKFSGAPDEGWIYVMYVEGGFLLPKPDDKRFELANGDIFSNLIYEEEVAVPGGVAWEDIMAYVNKKDKKIYFREGFKKMDPKAYQEIYEALSLQLN